MQLFYTAIFCLSITTTLNAEFRLVETRPAQSCRFYWNLDSEYMVPQLQEVQLYIYEGSFHKKERSWLFYELDYTPHRSIDIAVVSVYMDYQGSNDVIFKYHKDRVYDIYNHLIKTPYHIKNSKWYDGDIIMPPEIQATKEVTNYYTDTFSGGPYVEMTQYTSAPCLILIRASKHDLADRETWRQHLDLPTRLDFK